MGYGAATPAGLHLRECVGLQSSVSVSGRVEKKNIRHRVRAKADENKTINTESRSQRGAEVRKIGHYLDPNESIIEDIMSYFLLR